MLLKLLLLFTVVPLVELYLLIKLGTYIGAFSTIAIVLATGLAGSLLARSQGLAIVYRVRSELTEGRVPAGTLFDGLLILIAGALLITPGLLTDCLGFVLLIPQGRQLFKGWLKHKLREMVAKGEVRVYTRFEK